MERATVIQTTYRLISTRIEAWQQATERRPEVKAEVDHYMSRIADIGSVDAFLRDDRVFRFAMAAFGLSEMAYAKAFMRKVLVEGVDDPATFANRLADGRYRELAEAFNFKRYGEATTIFDRTRQGTVDRYVRQKLEEEAGATDENVRLALYFERKAPAITSPLQILADRALVRVVYSALGLAPATSSLAIDAQAELITRRLDITDFRSPEKLRRFLDRFAARADADNATSAARSPAFSVLLGREGSGLGVDLLMAAQKARFGS
jgi:hypothetical protein